MAILAAITIASLPLISGHASALIAAADRAERGHRSGHRRARRCSPGPNARTTLTSAERLRWLSDQIILVRRGLRVFTQPRLGAAAIAAQLAAWAVQTLAAYAVLHALNLQGNAGLAAAAAILLAVNVTALVPVTPSNIGIFQAATIAVLAAYGVDAGHALAYGILLQAVEITTAIVLGVPALLGERISLTDIRRYATTAPTPPPPSRPTTKPAPRRPADVHRRLRRQSMSIMPPHRDALPSRPADEGPHSPQVPCCSERPAAVRA